MFRRICLSGQGLLVVTLNEVKGLGSLCESKAGRSQRFWIPHCVRNDMAREGGSELRGWGRRFRITWLRKAVRNDMAGKGGSE